jgi:hypothetical protein
MVGFLVGIKVGEKVGALDGTGVGFTGKNEGECVGRFLSW